MMLLLLGLTSCSGTTSEADRILGYMAKDPEDIPRQREGLQRLIQIGGRAIGPVVRFYRKHRDPDDPKVETADVAVESVARIREREALPKLFKLAKEPYIGYHDLSLCAVYAIRAMATEEDVPALVGLAEDDSFLWKARLIEILGKVGGQDARNALLRYLRHKHPAFRRGALLGLKALGDSSLVPEIHEAFQREGDARIRITAAEALASLGDDRGETYLADALEGENPEHVLAAAAYASGRVKAKRAVQGLTKLLHHNESYYRFLAKEALEMIGTDDALRAIEQNVPANEQPVSLWSGVTYFHLHDSDPFMDWDWELGIWEPQFSPSPGPGRRGGVPGAQKRSGEPAGAALRRGRATAERHRATNGSITGTTAIQCWGGICVELRCLTSDTREGVAR